MAKATLDLPRAAGKADLWRLIGPAVEEVRRLSKLSPKEFAALVGRDESVIRAWIEGEERPQLETIFAVPQLRGLLVLALAALAEETVTIETTITVRRTA